MINNNENIFDTGFKKRKSFDNIIDPPIDFGIEFKKRKSFDNIIDTRVGSESKIADRLFREYHHDKKMEAINFAKERLERKIEDAKYAVSRAKNDFLSMTEYPGKYQMNLERATWRLRELTGNSKNYY